MLERIRDRESGERVSLDVGVMEWEMKGHVTSWEE